MKGKCTTWTAFSPAWFLIITILAYALLFLNQSAVASTTIVVGGKGSQDKPDAGIFVTAEFINPVAHEYRLPGIPNARAYRRTESQVYLLAMGFAMAGDSVNLIGYSHGATLILRVAHRLYQNRVPLSKVTIVTVDRVANFYPLKPRYQSVPVGIAWALNIYQTKGIPAGGAVSGSINIDASEEILDESYAGLDIDPTDPRFLKIPHEYMEDSFSVRRRIVNQFGIDYLGGIWTITITGQAEDIGSVYYSDDFVLDHVYNYWGFDIEARRWVGPEYSYFEGRITGELIGGSYAINTFNYLYYPLVLGTFRGFVAAEFETFATTELTGRWSGHELLKGQAQGQLVSPTLP